MCNIVLVVVGVGAGAWIMFLSNSEGYVTRGNEEEKIEHLAICYDSMCLVCQRDILCTPLSKGRWSRCEWVLCMSGRSRVGCWKRCIVVGDDGWIPFGVRRE